MEFFCQTDSTLICSFCVVMGTHKQHDVVAILDQNKACMLELRPSLEEATKSYHGLKSTAKKLENILSGASGNYQTLAQDVHSHFQHLHSLLELRSHQLLSDLKKIDGDYIRGVQEELKGVLAKIKEFQTLRKDVADAVASTNPTNAAYLHDKLKSFRNLPCFLVNDIQDDRPTFEVVFDLSLSEGLKSYGEMRFTMPEKLSFVSSKDLPEGYIHDDLYDTDTESSSSADKCSLEGAQTPVSNTSGDNLPQASGADDTLSGKRVMVSHVRDPTNFYIQVCSLAVKLQKMQADINAFCRSPSSRLDPDDEPRVGQMYLAQFHVDNNWYRCRVQRLVPCDVDIVDGASFSQSSFKVEIFYVDYGNSEVVPLSRLRLMPVVFGSLPHLAIRCSLYNIATTKGDSNWKRESIAMFARLTEHRKLILMVVEQRADMYHVDLLDTDGDSGLSNGRTSVCDALVFLGMATFYMPVHSENKRVTPRRQFYSPPELHPGQTMNVFVSCIQDPNSMFVQEVGSNVEYLHKMIADLQEHCNTQGSETDIIYAPQVGTICLAQFLPDQMWYRAQVVALPGGSQVEVVYVDYGNKDIVPGISVRKIPDRFMRLPMQAIQVTLADVAPVASSSWSNEAKNKLTKLTSSVSLKMRVHSEAGPKGYPSVSLYLPGKEDFDLCINAILVREKVAETIGPMSMVVEVPCIRTRPTGAQVHSLVNAFEETSRAITRKKRLAKASYNSPPDAADALLAALEISAHQAVAPSSTCRPPPAENYVAMNVAHADSPMEFYVHLDKQKASLKSVSAELQQTICVTEGDADLSWEVGDSCAVKHTTGWERGVVESGEQDLQVRLVDRGVVVTVPKSEVLPLEKSLAELPPLVTKCHLADMVPAGGSNSWSKTAEEYFSEVLRTAEKIYLVQLGEEADSGSLPVDLMMEKIVDMGALEPMRREYKSIREQLREAGYGFIAKRAQESSSNDTQSKPDSETKPPSASSSARQLGSGDSKLPSAAQFHSLATEMTGAIKRQVLLSPDAFLLPAPGITPDESEQEATEECSKATQEAAKETPQEPLRKRETPKENPQTKANMGVKNTSPRATPQASSMQGLKWLTNDASKRTAKKTLEKSVPLRETSKETLEEAPKKALKEPLKEAPKETPKEPSRETSKETLKETPKETQKLTKATKDTPKVASEATAKQGIKKTSKDASKGTWEETPPKETPKETSDRAMEDNVPQVSSEATLTAALGQSPEATKEVVNAAEMDMQESRGSELGHLTKDKEELSGVSDEDRKDDKFVIHLSNSDSELTSEDEQLESRVIDDGTNPVVWVDRPFPDEKQLLVMPSHIDEDAVIYVQVLGKDIETYKTVKEVLTDTYSKRPVQQGKLMRVGQACIARYSYDGMYYRATILRADEKGIEVRFVDYGTVEYVNPDFIFTDLMFEELPKLCLEVEFYGLKPFSSTGKWSLKALDELHSMLVEHNCSMVVKQKPTEDARAKVLLFLPDKVAMYDFMLETGIALRKEEEPMEPREMTPRADVQEAPELVPCPYEPTALPESGVFPVLVTHLEGVTGGSVQLSKVAHASNQEQKEMNEAVDSFRAMAQELQSVAEDCPPLVHASVGTPCICKYSYDKKWYRALVTAVRKKKVTVLYVDFGNSEKVSLSKLVALPEKFRSLPMHATTCRFHGVRVGEDSEVVAVDMLSSILFKSGTEGFLARVKNMDSNPIEIDLLNSSLELVYQPLADKGYITLDEGE